MQAVLQNSSALGLFHFAGGRDYMMRSEKRPDPVRNSGSSGKQPPRRRRRRAGFFYKFFMTLLLLTLWPVGLLMLWQRRVRWGIPTKLLTSIVTLASCIILIGFALTVNTGNAQYTAVQDRINSFLDVAADALIETGGIVSERGNEMLDDMENVADALWQRGKIHLSDGIDTGIRLTQSARNGVLALVEKLHADSEPEDTPAPELPAVSPEESAAADENAAIIMESASPASSPAVQPSATPDADETAVPEAAATAQPVVISAVDPDDEAKESAEATAQTSTEPTAAPSAEPFVPSATLKPAAQATVYHSTDGKWYHTFNRCSGMTGGGAYTLEECAEDYRQCRACGAPDADLIGKTCLWMDADGLCHTGDDCSAFSGKYTLILRDDALAQGLTGCAVCGGDEYLLPNALLEGEDSDAIEGDAQ